MSEEVENQIRMDNIQLVLGKLLDRDDSGSVTPHEIGNFFEHIWDHPKTRLEINTISREIPEDDNEEKLYRLVK